MVGGRSRGLGPRGWCQEGLSSRVCFFAVVDTGYVVRAMSCRLFISATRSSLMVRSKHTDFIDSRSIVHIFT